MRLSSLRATKQYRAMIVCLCHRVSDCDIVRQVGVGSVSFGNLRDELRVATGSGGCCADCARRTFAECRRVFAARTGSASVQTASALA